MKCPGCGYERKCFDTGPEWQCPCCKIAYIKHPNYQESSNVSIQLLYNHRPHDEEVKSGIIYLYAIKDGPWGATEQPTHLRLKIRLNSGLNVIHKFK